MGIQREVAVTLGTVRDPASGAMRTVLVLDPEVLTLVEGAIRWGACVPRRPRCRSICC